LTVIAASVFAAGDQTWITVTNCQSALTNSAISRPINGCVDSFWVDVPSGWTGNVTIATGRETLLSVTNKTADAIYRARIPACNINGNSLQATNSWERPLLVGEVVTATVSTVSLTTQTVSIAVRWEK